MTVEQIKTLPRTEEGIFDLSSIGDNAYRAALEVYPVYTAYETRENGKKGYPDIMSQMRLWNKKINADFSFENAAAYLAMLYGTIENMSPEIYENYRELVDMFRAAVKRVLAEYYSEEAECFASDVSGTAAWDVFSGTVRKACAAYLLLEEKYQMCF
ncbi:MAG: hypothetical protein E7291_08650 [Lachnospiraceae bacterium]|nr:hypothetical protein [Lachnospiraceae bacterium]